MHLYVVIDPANGLYWVWLGTEDEAASGTRTRVSPQGWDHQADAATWGQGFAQGVTWATGEVKVHLEETLKVIGDRLSVTT